MSIFKKILSKSNNNKKILLKDEKYSYAEFYNDTILYFNLFKKYLKKNDVISISLNYSKDYLNIIFAAQKNQNIVTFINPKAPMSETKFIIKNSKSKMFISKTKFKKGRYKIFNDLFIYFCNQKKNHKIKNGDAFIIYTSGTTSKPKGVLLTTKSVTANIQAISQDLKLKKKDSSIIFSPPHYAMAYSQILTYMSNQMSFIFINSGLKFPLLIINKIIEYNLNIINLSISSFRILYPAIKKKKNIFNNIRLIMSGGMQMTYDIINNYKKIFPKAEIINFYGCTENSPRISHFHFDQKKIKKKANNIPVGKALKGVKIKIIGNKKNQYGKIHISGTSLMRGYLSYNKELDDKFKDNWLDTGDIGYFDKNKNLFLMGRDDDTFRVGHEKLCPEEVEPIIKRRFKIQEAIVGKSKNKILDWEPVLVLNKREFYKRKVALGKLKYYLNDFLVNYKIPTKIISLEKLPRTLYGKVDRKKINEIIKSKK